MKLFLKYLKYHALTALAYVLFTGIFAAAFALYRVPLGAVLYPALLCAALGLIFAAADFFKAKKKHKALSDLKELKSSMMTFLPKADTAEEEGYTELVEALRTQISEEREAAAARYRDAVEYFTVWAHQIKTPITSMRLTLDSEDSECAGRLSADLFQIEQYAEMVLAFLRLDSETSDYVFKEQPLDPIIENAAARFAETFIAKKIKLVYTPTNLRVVTDDKWLSFVLEQLLSNSLKYTKEGEVRIYLRPEKTLVIEDTGVGISASDLPRVFEKGYTGCNGRTYKRASGIGLYLCRRICGKIGVGISIESEEGKGTSALLNLEQYRPYSK